MSTGAFLPARLHFAKKNNHSGENAISEDRVIMVGLGLFSRNEFVTVNPRDVFSSFFFHQFGGSTVRDLVILCTY